MTQNDQTAGHLRLEEIINASHENDEEVNRGEHEETKDEEFEKFFRQVL